MNPSDDVVDQLVRRLIDALQPSKVILFGSRARGDASPDSDYDLLVVWQTTLSPAERAYAANRAVRDVGVPVDVLVLTPGEVAVQATWRSSVVNVAVREGLVLHDAA